MIKPTRIRSIALAAAGVGVVVDRALFAQQPSGIKRTVLQRVDDPGSAGFEAVMAIAEIAPGASSGKHFHHGVELAYILNGSMVVETSHGAKAYKAGDAIKNDSGAVHNAINKGTKPVKILAVYLVEKGKPMAESVP